MFLCYCREVALFVRKSKTKLVNCPINKGRVK